MKLNYKKFSFFLGLGIVVVLLIVASQLPSSVQIVSTPYFISTPAQDKYIREFMGYVAQLEQEGLMSEKEIRVEGSKPFIFILRPQNSQEITNNDMRNITDIALRAVSIFESRGGIRHDDIQMAFHRPTEQKILLVKRRDMPKLLSANEMTLASNKNYFTSLVNLAGPAKNGRQDYANSWSIIQALCLAYGGDFPDVDPVCNIISANAAASWVGMEQKQAAEIVNSYGMTQLGYLGNKEYRYRFIDFVYNDFIH